MVITNEKIVAPYFIFIKGINEKNDAEVLELLELGEGKLLNPDVTIDIKQVDEESSAYLFRNENWIHIIDSWYYSLWHSQMLSDRIEELGKKLEIFTCSFGDVDESFDFRYFKGGKKVREYIVDSPNWNNQVVRVDFGEPLQAELIILNKRDEVSKDDEIRNILQIAESLGIQLPKSAEGIKCYQLEGLD